MVNSDRKPDEHANTLSESGAERATSSSISETFLRALQHTSAGAGRLERQEARVSHVRMSRDTVSHVTHCTPSILTRMTVFATNTENDYNRLEVLFQLERSTFSLSVQSLIKSALP